MILITILKKLFDKEGMRNFRKLAIISAAICVIGHSLEIRSFIRDPDFEIILLFLKLISFAMIFMYIWAACWFEE